jgi:hypothetical protein
MVTIVFGLQGTSNMNLQKNSQLNWLSKFYSSDKLQQLSDNEIAELYSVTQPKKIKISQLENTPTDSYLVNSVDGFVPVHSWRNKGKKICLEVVTDSQKSIVVSYDHFFELDGDLWKYGLFLRPGDQIVTKTGIEKVETVTCVGEHEVYDFHINHENHRYYTNDISSHNSGSGKSLVMMNIALNWVQMGLRGVYITLELSEELTGLRTAAMLTNMSTKDIRRDKETAALKVKMVGKKAGSYQVKALPAQSNINDIRAFLKEYQIKTGNHVDFMIIDYLDLLMPVSAKVSPNDLFVKDKYVSEELRNLAKELGILMVTASQLNRSAVEEVEFDHSHISGGISKINTADNVFGIFTSRAMRERGRYQIQCMKSRSSNGVGQKIDLDYDLETMRITDSGTDSSETPTNSASNIMQSIKAKSSVQSTITPSSSSEENSPIKTEITGGSKVKAMIASLKKSTNDF